jgi:hypothetical protein
VSHTKESYNPETGIYSYKKDGQWFFSFCPPDQVASKRVDGKWYFLDHCGGGGGGDGTAPNLAPYAKTTYVDAQDQKVQSNVEKCFADSKDYADSIVADYALISYVDEQIATIELSPYAKTTDVEAGDATTLKSSKDYADSLVSSLPPSGSVDLSDYSTSIEMKAADDETLADAKAYADEQIDGINVSVDLSDYSTSIEMKAADDSTLVDAKAYTDGEIAAIPPTDLSLHATKKEVTDGDAKSLTDSKKYSDDKIAAIVFPPGTIVSDSEPPNAPNGTNWFDTVRLELFVRVSETWVASSPLGSRVSQGEIVQSQIIDELGNKVGVGGSNEVDTTFRIKSSSKTLISSAGSELGLYNLRTPTDDSHAVNLGYANQHFQSFQKPIGFKVDQAGVCTLNTIPNSGEFCGLNNSSPGSSTNANNYFGNWNAGIRVHIDKLLNPQGNQFEVTERYSIAGTVSIFGKDTNKLFFRHSITAVVRDSSHPYVELIFATRVPTFGTGEINAESKYVVIVDGLTALETKTTLVPEGGETE